MNVQEFINDFFFVKGEFSTQRPSAKAQGAYVSNYTLEGLQEKGLAIHYELRKDNNGQAYICLSCQLFPNWTSKAKKSEEYISAVMNYYPQEKARFILEFRKKLLDAYYKKEEGEGILYPQSRQTRYLWLAKSAIRSDCAKEELQAKVWGFIAKTYPYLIQTIERIQAELSA